MSDVPSAPSETFLKYSWQHAVLDALIELRPERLQLKISAAERAIAARLRDPNPPDLNEQLALQDAARSLHVLFPQVSEPRTDISDRDVQKKKEIA
jgi:hypothetical protein